MENIFLLNDEEKNRILNLHETATKNLYLIEQNNSLNILPSTQNQTIVQGSNGDPYQYMRWGGKVYYAKKSEGKTPNWVEVKNPKGIGAINSKIFKLPTNQPTKTVTKKTNNDGGARILKKLKEQGFTVDFRSKFEPTKGYFVSACKEHGCAEFTNDMLNTSLGDAWQAYAKVNAEVNVTPSVVQQMTNLFNKMNKSGQIPKLETKGPFDSEAKTIIEELIPDQSKFQHLPIGTVVGLYFPGSVNYDLAFFQSAIGKSRDKNGNLLDVISKPYFCKNPNNCSSTTWSQGDLRKNVKFYPGNTLSSGKAFAPNTHLGFIGYIDKNGVPYVVHNVHQEVFAYPVNRLGSNGLSIVWSSNPA